MYMTLEYEATTILMWLRQDQVPNAVIELHTRLQKAAETSSRAGLAPRHACYHQCQHGMPDTYAYSVERTTQWCGQHPAGTIE